MNNNLRVEIAINDYIVAMRMALRRSEDHVCHVLKQCRQGYVAMENGYIQVKRCVYANAVTLLRWEAHNQKEYYGDFRALNLAFLSELLKIYAVNKEYKKYNELSEHINRNPEMLSGNMFSDNDYFTIGWPLNKKEETDTENKSSPDV